VDAVSTSSKRKKVETFEDLSGDLAGTFRREERNASGKVEQTALDASLAQLDRDGYVVLDGAITPEQLAEAKQALAPLLGQLGRNDFEGLQTQRVYSLLQKTRALDLLVAHPLIMAILEKRLPDALLSACLAINICPGEKAQIPHYDAAFYPDSRQQKTLAISVIWALDPFTAENGATTVWPGSHLWKDERRPTEADEHCPATMPAGSAVVFSGNLWHGGGVNRANESRLALTAQYCAPWLRTQENMSLAVAPSTVATLSEELQALLGYAIHPPFMGHVNGMHPKRLLEAQE